MEMRKLTHDEIEIDGGTQARAEINYFVVAEYAEAYRRKDEFPPLVVYHDGAKNWLSRGFHRYHASKDAGVASILCEVRKGSKRDAVWDSLADNQTHGIRRTNSDIKKACHTALKDKEWSAMSDRAIAEHIGVSDKTVGKHRDELRKFRSCHTRQDSATVGRDGKKRRKPRRRVAATSKPAPLPLPPDEPEIDDVDDTPTPEPPKRKPETNIIGGIKAAIRAAVLKAIDGQSAATRLVIADYLDVLAKEIVA